MSYRLRIDGMRILLKEQNGKYRLELHKDQNKYTGTIVLSEDPYDEPDCASAYGFGFSACSSELNEEDLSSVTGLIESAIRQKRETAALKLRLKNYNPMDCISLMFEEKCGLYVQESELINKHNSELLYCMFADYFVFDKKRVFDEKSVFAKALRTFTCVIDSKTGGKSVFPCELAESMPDLFTMLGKLHSSGGSLYYYRIEEFFKLVWTPFKVAGLQKYEPVNIREGLMHPCVRLLKKSGKPVVTLMEFYVPRKTIEYVRIENNLYNTDEYDYEKIEKETREFKHKHGEDIITHQCGFNTYLLKP